MRFSIRHQLLLPLLTLLLGGVAISTWTALASAANARQQIDAQVAGIILTAQQSKFPLTKNVLHLMKGFSGADFLFVEGDHRWTTLSAVDIPLAQDLPHGTGAPMVSNARRVEIDQCGFLCSAVRLEQGPSAGADLYVFYPESLWRDALWGAIRPSLILGAFGGLAAIVLTVGLGHRLARRILDLERRTRLIAAGDFNPMPPPRRNDELRDLSVSINDMAQKLAQLQDAMRNTDQIRLLGQVSGGLAHQMRNGVAGARLAIQLQTREQPAVGAGRGEEEPLQVALRQLTLVETHLKQFLSLGRAAEQEMSWQLCHLATILSDAVSLITPQCRHAQIDLTWHAPLAPADIHGDAAQLGQLFLNLLTNAIEAAGPRGGVEIRLQPDGHGGQMLAQVIDTGPGPPLHIAQRLFEPFITGKAEGVGLGLAVARRIAEAHGGSITWCRTEERTWFTLALPLREVRT